MPIFILCFSLLFTTLHLYSMEEPIKSAKKYTNTQIKTSDSTESITLEGNIVGLFNYITDIIDFSGESDQPIRLEIDTETMNNVIKLSKYYLYIDKDFSIEKIKKLDTEQSLKLANALNYLDAHTEFLDAGLYEIAIILKDRLPDTITEEIVGDLIPKLIILTKQSVIEYFQQKIIEKNEPLAQVTKNTITAINNINTLHTRILKDNNNQSIGLFIENATKPNAVLYRFPSASHIMPPVFDSKSNYGAVVRILDANNSLLDIVNFTQDNNRRRTTNLDANQKVYNLTFNHKEISTLFFTCSPKPLIPGQNYYESILYALNPADNNRTLVYTEATGIITALACSPSEQESIIAYISYNKSLESELAIITKKDNSWNFTKAAHFTHYYDCSAEVRLPLLIFLNQSTIITASTKNTKSILLLWKLTNSDIQQKPLITKEIDEFSIKSLTCDPSGTYIAALVESKEQKECIYIYTIRDKNFILLAQLEQTNQYVKDAYTSRRVSFFTKDSTLYLFAPFWQEATIYTLWTEQDIALLNQLGKIKNNDDYDYSKKELLAWLAFYKVYVKKQEPSKNNLDLFNELNDSSKDFLKKFSNQAIEANNFKSTLPQKNTQHASNNSPATRWLSGAKNFMTGLYNKFATFNWRQKAATGVCVGAACAIGAYAAYKHLNK